MEKINLINIPKIKHLIKKEGFIRISNIKKTHVAMENYERESDKMKYYILN